ncbi:unnamed protein product, partial [Iphiclides podalirius]
MGGRAPDEKAPAASEARGEWAVCRLSAGHPPAVFRGAAKRGPRGATAARLRRRPCGKIAARKLRRK